MHYKNNSAVRIKDQSTQIKLAQKHAYQTDRCPIGDTPKVKPKQDALRVLSSLLPIQVPRYNVT